MFCRKCGKRILDDSKFCQYCGEEVKEAVEPTIDKTIILSTQEAKRGVEKEIVIDGLETPLKILIPTKVFDGQLLCLRKVKVMNSEGRKVKRDIYVKLEIKDKE